MRQKNTPEAHWVVHELPDANGLRRETDAHPTTPGAPPLLPLTVLAGSRAERAELQGAGAQHVSLHTRLASVGPAQVAVAGRPVLET